MLVCMKLIRLVPALVLAVIFTAKPALTGAQTASDLYAQQEGFVDAHGVLIYYVEFGKGEMWEHGRYSEEYEKLAWGPDYFPFLYGARPDSNYDPAMGNAPTNWELYRVMWGEHGEFIIDGNLKSVEYVDRLATIHVPTLVMAGDHDECDPSLSREMHEKIAGSKLEILPNAGHMNFVDEPVMWQKTVQGFLAE